MGAPQVSPVGERFRRADRLLKRRDFVRCYREGRRRHGSFVVLYFAPNEQRRPRLGVTASRKVGSSVVRHRLRRRVREIFRRLAVRSELPPLDLVVHFRPRADQVDFGALRDDLVPLLQSVVRRRGEAS